MPPNVLEPATRCMDAAAYPRQVSVEEFFDSHYLVRNMASLFGIPADRMKVPSGK